MFIKIIFFLVISLVSVTVGAQQSLVSGDIDDAKFESVEEAEDVAAMMGIRNIPTLIFFKNGQEVDRHVGAANKAMLQQKFDANI